MTKRKGEVSLGEIAAIFCTGTVLMFIVLTAFPPLKKNVQPTKSLIVPDVNNISLPSPAAIQELLNRLEPEPRLKVDGKIGPLTLEKWNRVYCEQSAKKASEGYYK